MTNDQERIKELEVEVKELKADIIGFGWCPTCYCPLNIERFLKGFKGCCKEAYEMSLEWKD